MNSGAPASPLRYPGGKAALAPLLATVLEENDLHDGLIAEPFAGGAGASLRLLFGEYASQIVINDLDKRILAFWKAVRNQSAALIDRISSAAVTMETWHECQRIYLAPSKHSQLDVAFATFFLNRCNRSGILHSGGPIGGYEQEGPWKLDARYDASALAMRVARIAEYRERISVEGVDVLTFLADVIKHYPARRRLVFIDPPYYEKGQRLYLNKMTHSDHLALSELLKRKPDFFWILTYDNVPPIREMYEEFNPMPFTLRYTANVRREGKELLVVDPRLSLRVEALDSLQRPGKLHFSTRA